MSGIQTENRSVWQNLWGTGEKIKYKQECEAVSVFLSVWRVWDLRGSFGCIGVFPLAAPLSEALGWDVVSHLPVVTHLVGLGHVLETLLITGRQSLKSQHRDNCHDTDSIWPLTFTDSISDWSVRLSDCFSSWWESTLRNNKKLQLNLLNQQKLQSTTQMRHWHCSKPVFYPSLHVVLSM